tara:strand:+ start:371 stop:1018 length:648 start_codon:yes stop_codon:yes gene_type:complete
MSETNIKLTPSQVFEKSAVIPVVVIEQLEQAVPLAQALLAGGIPIIEITLRSDCALDAVKAIRAQLPAMFVGVGTVLNDKDFHDAKNSGAQFAISPGASTSLLRLGQESSMTFIPGVATPSEIIKAMDFGYQHFKFFPAQALGGVNMLKAFAGPLPHAQFCATGGISLDNAPSYLALSNVLCVGGSWIVPHALIAKGDWQAITELCRSTRAQLQH